MSGPNDPTQIQIYTHNIRCDTNNRMDNEQPWSERKHGVIDLIQRMSMVLPTLVGLQEVKHNQVKDILNMLGPEWAYFGVGRDDGETKGEYSPILFKKSDWELLYGSTYWLSETPDRPSKGWDAALARIVTKGILRHKDSNKIVSFFNTHYDHRGKQAREKSSLEIMSLMNDDLGTSVLCGDFNSEPHHEAYKTLSKSLVETSQRCKERRGFEHTVTGFTLGKKESSIDFIWVPPNIPIILHEVIDNNCNGMLCSDHRPVRAIIEI
ncbi:uncharacterized protein SPAPADRAFT_71736 [Spathaspora passalidarum NRRL Y-27907]|uniref:Endonuclease/exonuclease/phosphatase domain-containing protein n=1 Tax=Spathaspora passalidarum (strain NRRL Y-27907 / 11-Y1) TaxID=619300 RepID=G3APW0_SPAPN|nr:uncharacterized protein SPAPADRAFT_71736 [Spathaspora passalidarum NRRL Y-27907]EGW32281.1 hypothetical protein SPAPADRAFT_71736 [Spathaspora passalidarum NRRL Y-27907]